MKKSHSGPPQLSGEGDLRAQTEAARALQCNFTDLAMIDEVDPFNPENKLRGFMCKEEGAFFGSMVIISVNGAPLRPPLLIYGTPNINDVYKPKGANRSDRGNFNRSGNRGPTSTTPGLLTPTASAPASMTSSGQQTRVSGSLGNSIGSTASGDPLAGSSRTDLGTSDPLSQSQPPEDDNNAEDNEHSSPWAQLEPSARIYIANKWNGQNLTVYKYENGHGGRFVSIMPRGQAFLKGESYRLLCLWLQIPRDSRDFSALPGGSSQVLMNIFPLLEQPDVRSITYELIGRSIPQLVRYDFDLKLEPLFATVHDGTIIPQALLSASVITVKEGEDPVAMVESSDEMTIRGEFGPYDFDGARLAEFARVYRKRALELNKAFREQHGLRDGYRTENFIVEGKIVFLLNNFNGTVSRSSIFKLKPTDTAMSHVEMMDVSMQTSMFEALEKIHTKGLRLTPETLRVEMDLSTRVWDRLGTKLLNIAQARPNFTLAKNRKTPKMLIVMGLPGSGKSTISNKLATLGWVRVNQDEMGTRKVVESRARSALEKGQNVLVDRCNFDFDQRSHFLDLAHKAGVTDVRCLWLDTPADVCKQRVQVRKDHPTIPEGQIGIGIIDRFKSSLVAPMPGEGFCQIVRTVTDADVDAALENFARALTE